MSSSDQSDDGIYQSDEEITSFLHMRNSSSDETLDRKEDYIWHRRDSGRGSLDGQTEVGQSLSTKPRNLSAPAPTSGPSGQVHRWIQPTYSTKTGSTAPKASTILGRIRNDSAPKGRERQDMNHHNMSDELAISETNLNNNTGERDNKCSNMALTCNKSCRPQIFEFGTDMQHVTSTSNIKARLLDLMKHKDAVSYLSSSFMKDWTISSDVPYNVICDVCVFSHIHPVRLLTLHQGGESGDILRYNAKITRHFVSKVRKVSLSNFTAIGVVLDEADCKAPDRFMLKMQQLEKEARRKFIPTWLHMDETRCSQIVEIFLKMSHECGKKWLDASYSSNEFTDTVKLTTTDKFPSDTSTLMPYVHSPASNVKPSKYWEYKESGRHTTLTTELKTPPPSKTTKQTTLAIVATSEPKESSGTNGLDSSVQCH